MILRRLPVVDVELGILISSLSSSRGDAHKLLADHVINDIAAHRAVFVEDLIDDVPAEDLALISGHKGGGVVLEDASESRLVVDVANP